MFNRNIGVNYNDNSALSVSGMLKMADNSPSSVDNCFMTVTDSAADSCVLPSLYTCSDSLCISVRVLLHGYLWKTYVESLWENVSFPCHISYMHYSGVTVQIHSASCKRAYLYMYYIKFNILVKAWLVEGRPPPVQVVVRGGSMVASHVCT